MIKKIRRNIIKNIFVDLEKEEKWLNKMCSDGYALKDISNGYYIFEECNPNEYIYRVEFIKSENTYENKESYKNFMQEMNVDLVSSVGRWHYFRKKSCLGKFDIYSDIDSKIEHYKRINIIWYIIAFIFIFSGLSQPFTLIQSIFWGTLNVSDIIVNLILIIIGAYFLTLAIPLQRKISRLLKEKRLHE